MQLFFSAFKFVAYLYETGIAKSLGGLAEGPIVGPYSSLFLIGLAFVSGGASAQGTGERTREFKSSVRYVCRKKAITIQEE